jgi:hypothetical protein
LCTNGIVRKRFLVAMQQQGSARISRNVVRGVCRPSIAPAGLVFTTTGTGFDHRQLIPPFAPSGGGEDTLFGVLLGICNPHALCAHVPLGLAHAPIEPRVYMAPEPEPTLIHLLLTVASNSDVLPHLTNEERMRIVGCHLLNTAQVDAREFRRTIAEISRHIMQGWAEMGIRHLAIYGDEPTDWAKFMRKWLQRLHKSIEKLSSSADVYPYAERTREDKLRIIQQYFINYGHLLLAWPNILNAARSLRQRERRLASRLQ